MGTDTMASNLSSAYYENIVNKHHISIKHQTGIYLNSYWHQGGSQVKTGHYSEMGEQGQ